MQRFSAGSESIESDGGLIGVVRERVSEDGEFYFYLLKRVRSGKSNFNPTAVINCIYEKLDAVGW